MGTLKDMEDMARLTARAEIELEIGVVLPMERADEGLRAMGEGRPQGRRSLLDKIGILPAQAP
jgi:hypothetical protein